MMKFSICRVDLKEESILMKQHLVRQLQGKCYREEDLL